MSETRDRSWVWNHFFVPQEWTEYAGDFDAFATASPGLVNRAAGNFKRNVQGAVHTLSLPFIMAMSSCQSQRFIVQTFRAANELLISGKSYGKSWDDFVEVTAATAYEATHRAAGDRPWKEELELALENFCRHGNVVSAAEELLRQGIVLLWGSTEVFAREAFVAILDTVPGMRRTVLQSREMCRLFDLDKLKVSDLEAFDFDLTGRLGEILLARKDLKSLSVIKAAFGHLFPTDAELRDSLSDTQLWTVAQQRHLIVHKRGIVDAEFKSSTGSSLALGDELKLRWRELTNSVKSCCRFARCAIAACNRFGVPTSPVKQQAEPS